MFEDTYFLDATEALRVASMENRSASNLLQVCYYAGEKIESELVNLIHLPFENFVDNLSQGIYRLPTKIDFTGLEISPEIKLDITNNFNILLEQAKQLRSEYNMAYFNAIKERKLNFDEPLRFYLPTASQTQVMQHVSRAIANTLKSMGYDVILDVRHQIEDTQCLKNIFLANPHVTININNMFNNFLSEDVFNFVWFQDPMPYLLDETEVEIRKRDFVFSLLPMFDTMLERKKIPYQRQGFCINEQVYKRNPNIKRERKIVFIGSSYLKFVANSKEALAATEEVTKVFLEGKAFTQDIIEDISKRYHMSKDFVESRFIPYVVRDIGLMQLCNLDIDYEIEIYGWGWDVYKELKPYYKGVLEYGNEIAEVYNSATFAFAPHQQYTLQQRTFEASACGAIPIVYDCRDISDEPSYDEALCYYKTTQDLENILKSDIPKKDFTKLLEHNTYSSFVKRIIEIIQKNR